VTDPTPGIAPGGSRFHALRALRHREFTRLFVASTIGDLGYWISFVALQAHMAEITDGSGAWLGVLFFANFIPMLVFAPYAGSLADRMDRTRLMVLIRSAIGVVALVMAGLILAGVGTPGATIVIAFFLGTGYGFLGPAQGAAVANTIPSTDLLSAVSMSSAGSNFCRVAGPALGAPVLAIWGPGWSFVVYGASSLLVAAMLVGLRLRSHLDPHTDIGAWRRIVEGLRHARERPPAVAALVTMSVFSVFGGAQIALYPLFATEVHDRPTQDFTAIVVASGVGAVLGAMTTGLRRTVPGLRAALGWLIGFGVASVVFGLARSWGLALGAATLVGFCYFSMTTVLATLLQHLADDAKRGRIMSLFVMTWGGIIPIGAVCMGALADAVGAPAVVVIASTVCVAYALATLAWTGRAAVRTAVQPSAQPSGQPSTEPLR
jgi:MFS family permease